MSQPRSRWLRTLNMPAHDAGNTSWSSRGQRDLGAPLLHDRAHRVRRDDGGIGQADVEGRVQFEPFDGEAKIDDRMDTDRQSAFSSDLDAEGHVQCARIAHNTDRPYDPLDARVRRVVEGHGELLLVMRDKSPWLVCAQAMWRRIARSVQQLAPRRINSLERTADSKWEADKLAAQPAHVARQVPIGWIAGPRRRGERGEYATIGKAKGAVVQNGAGGQNVRRAAIPIKAPNLGFILPRHLERRRHAAVDYEDLACDVAGVVRTQEVGGVGDFRGDGRAPQRDTPMLDVDFLKPSGLVLVAGAIGKLGHTRIDETRSDAVDQDAVIREIAGKAAGEIYEATLGRGVGH